MLRSYGLLRVLTGFWRLFLGFKDCENIFCGRGFGFKILFRFFFSYGSFASGLGIPSSDLDLVIVGVPQYPSGERSPLQILASVLKRMRWLTTVHAIETAKVNIFMSLPPLFLRFISVLDF
jgi:hypothetical protein